MSPIFDLATKAAGLKALMDYSIQSGHRWHRIRNEIVSVLDVVVTDQSPLLTRQDLEHWAEGRSVIGDEKFRLIYEFLTHPTSLKRPIFLDFQKALGGTQQARRVGAAMAEFLGSESASSEIIKKWRPQ